MRIGIINQFGPPDASPTARLAGDLCSHWRESGHDVDVLVARSGGGVYRRRQRGIGRWMEEAVALLELTLRALWMRRCDGWVVFSSPPMVVAGVAWVGRFRGIPIFHWVLDSYPDVARALGMPLPVVVYRLLRWMMRCSLGQCREVVAVSPAMQRRLREQYGVASTVIAPWPERPEGRPEAKELCWRPTGMPDGFEYWIYSGNMGMAHAWRVLLDVMEILNQRAVPLALVIQGGGAGWLAAREEAARRQIQHVHCIEYAAAGDLMGRLCGAVARVATQRQETSGLLWPSKLALLQCLPGPLLWIGPEDDVGPLTHDPGRPNTCYRFSETQAEDIASCLERLAAAPAHGKQAGLEMIVLQIKESIDRNRDEGLTQWSRLVEPTPHP